MKITLTLFLSILFSFALSAQGEPVDSVRIVNPSDFPEETTLPGNVAFYTREGGQNRKVTLDAIFEKTVELNRMELQRWNIETATSTLSLLYTPDAGSLEVFRGVIRQTINTVGSDITLTGNQLNFNYRNLAPGETVTARYKRTYN